MDLVRAGITEKQAFLRSAEKWFLAKKWVLPKKITQNDIFPLDVARTLSARGLDKLPVKTHLTLTSREVTYVFFLKRKEKCKCVSQLALFVKKAFILPLGG